MKAAFTPFTSLTTSCDIRLVRRVMGLFFAFFLLIPLGVQAQDKPAGPMADSWTGQTGIYSRFTPNRYSANGIYSGYTAGDELTELRTRDSKTFSNGNGTNDLFYIGRLHYKNENGKWSDIDVSIKQTSTPKYEGYDYQNLTNDFKTYYSTDPTKGFIMDCEGHSYTLAQNYGFSVVANASDPGKAIATQGSLSKSDFRTLKVRNYASGIDYEMIQTSQGVETGFWLRNKSAYQNASSGYLMMEQTIDLPAGCALAVDGKVQKGDFTASSFALLAPNGTPAVTFKKVTLYDAAFSYEEIMQDVEMNALAPQIGKDGKPIADKRDSHRLDVQYVVKREGNQAKVCFLIPVAWLNQPDRLFPVYVDPYYYAENVTTGSTTCTSSYVMYCTYYHDARWDYRISSAALSAAGLTNGATISAMGLLCSSTPGQTVANARIDLSNSYSSWEAGTSTWMNSGWQNCYYASSLPTPTVSASTWNNYTFSSSFPYNSSNGGLVFRLTRDGSGWSSGGGHYVTGSTTTDAKSMYSDSGNGDYPFASSSASSTSAYIPCMRLTYTGGAEVVETPCDMWGGSGTSSNPYTISNEAGLVCLRNNVNQGISYNGKYFRLTADIALTGSFNTGTSSAPIGSSFAFQGSFDGNNHTISNLNLSAAAASQALFGYTTGAVISNLTVRGTNQGTYQTGGIVGNASNTVIDNCVSYVTFSVSSYQRGGIVGTATGCTISECTNNANFTASYGSGGIVGEATNTQITDCINNGNLTTASYNIGGIVGRMLTGTTVNDCVNYGSITTTSTYSTTSTNYGIGGIVGYSNYGSAVSTAVITNCTNRGSITSTCYLTGGIVGYHYYYGHITYCNNYGNISTTGSTYYVGGIVGRNYGYNSTYPTRIDYCNNYANVNGYEYVGGIAGYTYGYSSSESSNGFVTYCVNSGEITGRYYYTGGIAGYAYYVQFRNNTNNGPVTGAGYYTAGIAGYCYYGYYQQYNINNADITSTSYYTGGIFGYSYYNYYNQYNENRGDVTGGGLYTGGINGYNYGSNYYCRYNLNSGNVSSTSYYVGGINGYANYTYTDYCVNVGRVSSTYSGNAYVGGITGFATSSSAYTRYCLNAGKVSGYTYVGGIAGEGYYGNYISYCLNVGDVEGTVTGYTAAIAGYAYSGAPDNCYWDKQMCPTEYQYNTTTAPTYAKYTRELIGQNTYPSSSYWYSGTNLYPRPYISNVYSSNIGIVAATPIKMQDDENVGNALTCFTAYNGNSVSWSSDDNSLVNINGTIGNVTGTGETFITASKSGIEKEIDLVCNASAFNACFTAISPANHATAVSYTPTLEWEPITCTNTYNIYIGTTNYFGAATLYGSSSTTSYTVSPALDQNTTYYWWIVPSGMQTVDCTPWSFTTTCATPPSFTLTADQVVDCNSPVELHVSNVSNVTEWTYGEGVYESSGHIYVNPGHTTTYTVYGSNANCAPAGQSVTVYKNTAEASLTASTESCVEAGTEVTLTAEGISGLAESADQYQFSVSQGVFSDISGTSGVTSLTTGDDVSATYNLPFTFNINGTDYTSYTFYTNGYIYMGSNY
ncbi:MAG: hypothetical protein PUF10_03035, partial [Bacteroidales bacterium]|nr:hypothetical protein [Bacteroidales bacterium]